MDQTVNSSQVWIPFQIPFLHCCVVLHISCLPARSSAQSGLFAPVFCQRLSSQFDMHPVFCKCVTEIVCCLFTCLLAVLFQLDVFIWPLTLSCILTLWLFFSVSLYSYLGSFPQACLAPACPGLVPAWCKLAKDHILIRDWNVCS